MAALWYQMRLSAKAKAAAPDEPAKHGLLTRAIAVLCAVAVGVPVFLLTLMWPALFFRSDVMLAWGWIGGLLGIWLGWKAGGYAHRRVLAMFNDNP